MHILQTLITGNSSTGTWHGNPNVGVAFNELVGQLSYRNSLDRSRDIWKLINDTRCVQKDQKIQNLIEDVQDCMMEAEPTPSRRTFQRYYDG
jgi:hypothetical protein